MAQDYYNALMTIYTRLDQELRTELRSVTVEALKGDFDLQRKAKILHDIEAKIREMHGSTSAIENEALAAWWKDQQAVTRGQLAALGKADSDSALLAAADPGTWANVDHGAIKALASDMAGYRARFLGLLPNADKSLNGGILRQVDDYLRTLAGENIPRALAGESVYRVGMAIREGGIDALRTGAGLQDLAAGMDAALGVTYADGSVHSLQAYSQMAARTGVMRARTEASLSTMQQHGVHLFQVSTHGTICPLCLPFEGTVWAFDAEGERQGYQRCPVSWPRHPSCAHSVIPYLGLPAEGTPATPPDAAFEGDRAQREWVKEKNPELLQAARQGFSTQAEWNNAKKTLAEGHGVELSELRGPRYRYRNIEARRQQATANMLENPSLKYKDAMSGITTGYMQTPEYAMARATSGIYSPTRQRKIVDLANHGIDIPPRIRP